jgi:protein-tyrosine phosphatase
VSSPAPQVDLHAHVLPGVDDGAADESQALSMLERAAADGTRIIAATPHAGRCRPEAIIEGVGQLNALAEHAGLAIEVVPGCEYRLDAELVARYRAGQLVTLNSTQYLLVELVSWVEWPPYFAQAVYELQLAGLTPVLAHPERYPPVQRRPELVAEAARAGVVIQVNAGSLLGQHGKAARRAAETLVRARLAHLIASDAHDPRDRPPAVASALRRVGELAGEDYAAWVRQAAAEVVRGEAVRLPEPELPGPGPRRSWLAHVRSWLRGG